MNRSTPLAKIGEFRPEDPESLKRALSLLEGAGLKKAQQDDQLAIYKVTGKKGGTYNANAWEIARMDTGTGNCFVVLPDPLKVLGAWIGVKLASDVVSNTITVSAINATIDGAASYTLYVARQIVYFYATTDGWERGSTQ
jgi:hypothetical protein